MRLSKRLKEIASFVSKGYSMADIGTDHGFVPIYLVDNKITPYAIAMDINLGPLEIARDNIKKANLEDFIEVRQSNGVENLGVKEVDSLVIAGMGGKLIKDIISARPYLIAELKECILQPQSDIKDLRAFLISMGFEFVQEDIVEEDDKFYFIMKVKHSSFEDKEHNMHKEHIHSMESIIYVAGNSQEEYSQEELCFGRKLLHNKNPILKKFLIKEKQIKEDIISRLEGITIKNSSYSTNNHDRSKDYNIKKRLDELKVELNNIKGGLSYYDM